jgi:hypothetical protein
MQDGVGIHVLGPVEVTGPHRSVSLHGAGQRALIARLGLPPGSTVSREALIHARWDKKTLITHARTGAATFLGYKITTQTGIGGRRSLNGTIALRVPSSVIKSSCMPYLARGAPAAQRVLLSLDDYTIVAVYRGPVPGHRPVLPARR